MSIKGEVFVVIEVTPENGAVKLPDEYLPIFLAGPITGAPNWQRDAIQFIEELVRTTRHKKYQKFPTVVCYNPRCRKNWSDFEAQVKWETEKLNEAADRGLILFWFAPPADNQTALSYAQTSRFELGEWLAKRETREEKCLVLGWHPEVSGLRYVRTRYPDKKVHESLQATCIAAIKFLSHCEPQIKL